MRNLRAPSPGSAPSALAVDAVFQHRTSSLDQPRRLVRLARLLAISHSCESHAAGATLSIAEAAWDEKTSSILRRFLRRVIHPAHGPVGVSDRRQNWLGLVATPPFAERFYKNRIGIAASFRRRPVRLAARQPHREHRTLARLARHGHVAAHHARELARYGKAKAGSAEVLCG